MCLLFELALTPCEAHRTLFLNRVPLEQFACNPSTAGAVNIKDVAADPEAMIELLLGNLMSLWTDPGGALPFHWPPGPEVPIVVVLLRGSLVPLRQIHLERIWCCRLIRHLLAPQFVLVYTHHTASTLTHSLE